MTYSTPKLLITKSVVLMTPTFDVVASYKTKMVRMCRKCLCNFKAGMKKENKSHISSHTEPSKLRRRQLGKW